MADTEMADIEDVFETLALAVDRVSAEQGSDRAPLFLAKVALALALAQALNDPQRLRSHRSGANFRSRS